MTKRISDACPLCLSPSTFALFDYDQRKAYECPSCGQFVVTRMAENILNKPPGRKEQQIAGLSRLAGTGRIAEVCTEPTQNGIGRQLTVKIIERTSLPLP